MPTRRLVAIFAILLLSGCCLWRLFDSKESDDPEETVVVRDEARIAGNEARLSALRLDFNFKEAHLGDLARRVADGGMTLRFAGIGDPSGTTFILVGKNMLVTDALRHVEAQTGFRYWVDEDGIVIGSRTEFERFMFPKTKREYDLSELLPRDYAIVPALDIAVVKIDIERYVGFAVGVVRSGVGLVKGGVELAADQINVPLPWKPTDTDVEKIKKMTPQHYAALIEAAITPNSGTWQEGNSVAVSGKTLAVVTDSDTHLKIGILLTAFRQVVKKEPLLLDPRKLFGE